MPWSIEKTENTDIENLMKNINNRKSWMLHAHVVAPQEAKHVTLTHVNWCAVPCRAVPSNLGNAEHSPASPKKKKKTSRQPRHNPFLFDMRPRFPKLSGLTQRLQK